MPIFVGLDWGGSNHAVCIVDAAGKSLEHFAVAHDREGLDHLVARLRRHGPPAETPIAIERPSGLVFDVLIEAGFLVTPVHPNTVKACRPRYRAVAAKSDPGDAFILADILRTDGYRLTPLKPQSDAIKGLRALVRGRDDLVATRLVLANQLRALLDGFWPGAAMLFADIATPIALAFLQRYPSPEAAHRLGEKRMAAFLAQNQYCAAAPPSFLQASSIRTAGPTSSPGRVKRTASRSAASFSTRPACRAVAAAKAASSSDCGPAAAAPIADERWISAAPCTSFNSHTRRACHSLKRTMIPSVHIYSARRFR